MFYHPQTNKRIPEGVAFELEGVQYPSNWLNLSSPEDKQAHGIYEVFYDPKPEHSPITHMLQEGIIENRGDQYYQTWTLIAFEEETVQNNLKNAKEALQRNTVERVQHKLDQFAQTKGYDSIQSLANYAGDEDPIFNAEGTFGKSLRSRTWRALYNYLAEVEAGTKPVPTSVDEVITTLPVMEWPTNA